MKPDSYRSLKNEDFRVGMKVYITPEVANTFSIPYQHAISPDYKLPGGLWTIIGMEKRRIDTNIPLSAQPVLQLELIHETWDPIKVDPLLIVLNGNSEAILAGALLMDDCLLACIDDQAELARLNSTRFTCFQCDNPLNIVTHNVRICKFCESD